MPTKSRNPKCLKGHRSWYRCVWDKCCTHTPGGLTRSKLMLKRNSDGTTKVISRARHSAGLLAKGNLAPPFRSASRSRSGSRRSGSKARRSGSKARRSGSKARRSGTRSRLRRTA